MMVLAAVIAVSAPVQGSAIAASTSLSDGFESGGLGSWSSTSNITVGGAYAKTGSLGARAVATSTHAGYQTWKGTAIAQGLRYGRVRGWIKIISFNSNQSVDTLSLKNAHGMNHFDFFRDNNTGKWKWDLLHSNSATSTMVANRGQWYYVEALNDFGGTGGTRYVAKVQINGVTQPSVTSTGQKGTTVKSAWFGSAAATKTNTRYYDSLAVQVASSPFSLAGVGGS
jgi:hypothetical protein